MAADRDGEFRCPCGAQGSGPDPGPWPGAVWGRQSLTPGVLVGAAKVDGEETVPAKVTCSEGPA